ncbi:hypothetical protein GQ457_06G020480 [Hibiscus cannabinus]
MARLSQAIKIQVASKEWKEIHLSRHGPGLSHLFFADDLVLFAEATTQQMRVIRSILQAFCDSSGHKVSSSKTTIFFSANTERMIRQEIVSGFGFEEVNDLGKYLGVPLLHSRVKKATFGYLIEKVRNRLSHWEVGSLSLAGRITLARSVLHAIPNYTMQTMWLPKGVCLELEKIIRGFVWGEALGRKKLHLVRWEVACKPIRNGGLGFRQLEFVNDSFLMKLGFQLIHDNNKLWVRVLRAKYRWEGFIPADLRYNRCSRLWKGIARVWDTVKQGLVWSVRDGSTVDFWFDEWLENVGCLASYAVHGYIYTYAHTGCALC